MYRIYMKGGGKGLFGLSLFSVGVGVALGVVISHVFRSSVDSLWGAVPGLNQVKANYGYRY